MVLVKVLNVVGLGVVVDVLVVDDICGSVCL